MTPTIVQRVVLAACLVLAIDSASSQEQDDRSYEDRYEVVWVTITEVRCDTTWEKTCWTVYDPYLERGRVFCKYKKKLTNCREFKRRISLVFEVESDEKRKNRIASDANKYIKKEAERIKDKCDEQKENSRNPHNEEDEEFPDIDCQLIYDNYDILSHELETIENRVLEEPEFSTSKIYGRMEPHTSPGGRRYTKIWIDVVDHEVLSRKDREILVSVIHERIHSDDFLKDGNIEMDMDEESVEELAQQIVEVMDIPRLHWDAKRYFIGSVNGWIIASQLRDYLPLD